MAYRDGIDTAGLSSALSPGRFGGSNEGLAGRACAAKADRSKIGILIQQKRN
jgi:hypothetical protein